ncbi:MAG: hypothetical protein AAF614_07265 [Chloroflexota bacterium]
MTPQEMSKPHFRIKEIGGSLQITIPSGKPEARLVFSIIGLGIWIYLGSDIFRSFWTTPVAFFFVAFLGLVLVPFFFDIFWHLGGVETLHVDAQTLCIHHTIFRIPIRRKTIVLEDIEAMRSAYKRRRRDWYARRNRRKSPLEGPLAIDVDGKTWHYGNNINEGEAEQIIALIETYMKNS